MADLPSLSSKVSPEIRRAFEAVRRWLQSVESSAGSTTTIIQSSGGGGSTVPSGLIDYTVPPALTGLTATGGFNQIILQWNSAGSALVSYVEIWRGETDDVGAAVMVGTTSGAVYSDTPPDSSLTKTYYYWIRAVSPSSPPQYGPFNAVAGVSASTANEPDYVMEVLADALDGLTPVSTAPEIIYAADKFAIRSLSDAPSAAKYPFIVDATYGVIMDTALIKNLTATNIEVGSLTGDLLASGTSVAETNIIGGVLKSSDSLFYADMGNKIMTMADGLGNAVEITPAIVSYIRNNTAYYGITRIASGIAANGTYVSFSPAFVTVPEVYIVPINFTTYKASAAGYDQSISMSAANVSQNGFSVTCYTATGMPLTRFYDADIGFGYNSYGTFYSATDEIILSLVLSAYSSTAVEGVYHEYGVALEVQYYNGSTGVWTTLVYASAIYKNQIFTTPQLPTGYTHGMRVRLYANPIYSYVSVISSHTHTYSLSSSYTGGTVSWLAIERAS